MGLVLYPKHTLQGVDIQVGLGQQLLELGVLGLQVPQLGCIRRIHTTILGPPFVEGGRTDADLTTQLGNRQASLNALERINDLTVGKLGLIHVEILFEKFLLLTPVVLRGDYPLRCPT